MPECFIELQIVILSKVFNSDDILDNANSETNENCQMGLLVKMFGIDFMGDKETGTTSTIEAGFVSVVGISAATFDEATATLFLKITGLKSDWISSTGGCEIEEGFGDGDFEIELTNTLLDGDDDRSGCLWDFGS